jgi:hypothetical protein
MITTLAAALLLAAPAQGSSGAPDMQPDMRYGQSPAVLGPHAPRVGEWIPDLEFELLAGGVRRLSQVAGEKGLVIALRDSECPLGRKYAPGTAALEQRLRERGLGLLLVGAVDAEDCALDVERHGFERPYAVDGAPFARELQAVTTTEVFVLDASRTLRYRGMIDDQYGLGFALDAPRNTYLLDAVDAVAEGRRVATPATRAHGCLLDRSDGAGPTRSITYHERVSRIVRDRCESCHRPGAVGPFALTTYEQVAKKKRMIEWVLGEGIMPPWFADHDTGPWANDISLSDQEKDDFLDWIAGGAPEGDPANGIPAATWTEGWSIPEPDLVVEIPEPVEVPADGVVDYVYQYVQIDLPEDRWVRAMEIVPGAPEVVHHVLVFLESPELQEAADQGDREAQRRIQGGQAGFFAGAAPGQAHVVFPAGTGKLLPARSWLKFQLHYTPNGAAAVDATRIGFVFADEPAGTEVRTSSAINDSFAIPPHEADHEVQARFRFPEAGTLLSFMPHMHVRGRRFSYELHFPDGREERVLLVPSYDFNWQLRYDCAEPIQFPAGTVVHATAWFDNSESNPANPDPSAEVTFGEQTFDEMMIGYFDWLPAGG